MKKEKNFYEILTDKNNRDPLVLDFKGNNQLAFEQIAVIPHEKNLYCVLKPITYVQGVADDEALVFRLTQDRGLDLEEHQMTVYTIFEKYYELYEEMRRKKL